MELSCFPNVADMEKNRKGQVPSSACAGPVPYAFTLVRALLQPLQLCNCSPGALAPFVNNVC